MSAFSLFGRLSAAPFPMPGFWEALTICLSNFFSRCLSHKTFSFSPSFPNSTALQRNQHGSTSPSRLGSPRSRFSIPPHCWRGETLEGVTGWSCSSPFSLFPLRRSCENRVTRSPPCLCFQIWSPCIPFLKFQIS